MLRVFASLGSVSVKRSASTPAKAPPGAGKERVSLGANLVVGLRLGVGDAEEEPPERAANVGVDRDGPLVERHTREALAYCLAHPRWRLSLQTHKLLGIR